MDDYKLPSEPLANPDSTVIGPQYRFTLIQEKVLRYEWAEDGVFEDRASTFAINRNFPKPDFRVEDKDDQLDIITPSFHLTYDKKQFSQNGLVVTFSSKQTLWGSEWRYGEAAQDNLGGTARTLDCVDGRCDMGTGILSRVGFATLDDSQSMLFDDQGFVAGRRPGDRIDGYLFSYGYDYKGAMESFYAVSGRQPVIPRWSLGNWWSRYHAYDQAEYLALMDEFKTKEVPLSVAVIDMDWHLVKGDSIPHAGWTGYTWNRDLFPEPKDFTKALHDRGLKITLNDHPHAGIHHHEEVYEELARVLGHDTSNGDPILFDPTSAKFMHAFLNVVHGKLEEQGCDFWWIDWQQGNSSRVPGLDPLWLLNHFQFLHHTRDKSDSRSLIFSRYAGPGSHRYPVGFSGDTIATWESLEFQPEFTATASNIGYGWWSHDIGGHLLGYRDDECTTRWVQFGTFSPIQRLHSMNSRWMSKEPWLYRPECTAVMQHFLQLRHQLVPYIYSVNAAPSSSIPLIQPLYWNFPTRDQAYRFPNEYYFGPSLVISPVVSQRDKRTNLAKTQVWIPPSRHVDIFTGTVYDGDREIDVYRSLQHITALAPEGSIVPLESHSVLENGCYNPWVFEVLVVVGHDGRFEILEDSRDDYGGPQVIEESPRSIPIEWNQAAGRLTVASKSKEWMFRFVSHRANPSDVKVFLDGSEITGAKINVEGSSVPNTVVKFPTTTIRTRSITIELGADPQLATLDHSQAISNLLVDFQMEFQIKDQIWNIVGSTQPTALKISRLLSLGLEEAILGPIAELLLSDSRLP